MGGDPPEQKLFLSGSLGPKFSRVRWGKGAPPKNCHAPKNFEPHFRENGSIDFFLNFRDQSRPESLSIDKFIRKFILQIFCKMKKQKNSLWGAWPPNLTPFPHDLRDLSSTRRGADDPEKISEIARTVAEKIEFKSKIFGAPWRTNRKWAWSGDHMK